MDPRELGCLCDECPLQDQTPVLPEIRAGKMLILAEAPGAQEITLGRPLVGQSGVELERALRIYGRTREDVSLSNVMCCRAPAKSWRAFSRILSKKNRKRKKENQPLLKSPLECCKPRVLKEVEQAPSLLLFGATALGVVAGAGSANEKGLMRLRGFPQIHHGKPTIATYHPAFVLRARRWTETFRGDVGKAIRHAEGRLRWSPPEIVLDPTLAELEAALTRLERECRFVGVDTETDGLDPESCQLRCVGLAGETFGVVAGFRSVENPLRIFRCNPELARSRIAAFFRRMRPHRLVVHNQVFDRPVLSRHGMPLPDYHEIAESLRLHHVAESELPHTLLYLASRHTDAPAWKVSDHERWDNDCDTTKDYTVSPALHFYCALDCALSAKIVPPLIAAVKTTRQEAVYSSDVEFQRVAVEMRKAGMLIDQSERIRHAKRLILKRREALARAQEIAGFRINIGSHVQVRELLYETWGLPWPTIETDGGEPSTNKDAVYELEAMTLPEASRRFLSSLLEYRAATRSLGKDVLTPQEAASEGIDKEIEELEEDEERGGGIVIRPDGRVHPTWGTIGVTGRIQSSSPNLSNVPSVKDDLDSLRSMYVAAPGNVFVSADLEQVELRLVALFSGDEHWLRAFDAADRKRARGEKLTAYEDVHRINAAAFFETKPELVDSPLRHFAKTFCYFLVYGGQAETGQINMRRVKDPATGERKYANFSLGESRKMRDNLLRVHHWLPTWWDATVAEFRSLGFIREPILGRIRLFLDAAGGEDESTRNEIVNFRVQCATGSLMGGSGASGEVALSVGWPGYGAGGLGGPGFCHHGYDSITVEVRENRVQEAAKALEAAMNKSVTWKGRTIQIPAVAKIGRRWSEL